MSVKYRIPFGNCEADINQSIFEPVDSNKIYRADTTEIYASNTELTADYNL